MSYVLDKNNWHTKQRVSKVITWLTPFVKKQEHTPFKWHHSVLTKVFGKQGDALPNYLRESLLIPVSGYHPGVHSTYYLINKKSFRDLEKKFSSNSATTIINDRDSPFHDELVSGNFNYKQHETTPRETHPLQRMPKAERNEVFGKYGYVWDYDIESAAPSLILQYALKVGKGLSEDLFLPYEFPALDKLLKNKTQTRNELAESLEVEVSDVKQLLHGILMGGVVRVSTRCHPNKLAQYLRNDPARIIAANQNEFIIQLKKDFKTLWSEIEAHEGKRYSTRDKSGNKRVNPIKLRYSGKRKMACYNGLESKIRQVFESYLRVNGIKYCQIHDGFQSNTRVNVSELSEVVKSKTGYDVSFSESQVVIDGEVVSWA